MSGLTGFSAWISVDGMKLPIYGVETRVDEGRETISCWIASEVNKTLSVCWSIPPYPEGVVGIVWIDGMRIGALSRTDIGMQYTQSLSDQFVSDASARPLMFSKVEYTDDDAHLDTSPVDLGEIKLQIWTTDFPLAPPGPFEHPSQPPTEIHERSKKAIPHRVTFGEEFTPQPIKFARYELRRHLMSFVFKYRPREYLQAEGIIPPDPKPDTKARKRAAETPEPNDSEGDKHEGGQLESEREELQARLDLTKARYQKKKAKLEPRAPANLRVKTEIIDLT